MAEFTWEREQGVERLTEMCSSMKSGVKRSLYNRIEKAKEMVNQYMLVTNPTADTMRRIPEVDQALQNQLRDIRAGMGNLSLLMDQDIIKRASTMFRKIKQTDTHYEGDMGRLEITFRNATYYIGNFRIAFHISGSDETRLRVYNDDKPRNAGHPHPHVRTGDHTICLGTWREMMRMYCKDRWNWLRCLVMIGEFLTVYAPEQPYQKLAQGWKDRHITGRGEKLCPDCEHPPARCRCIRRGTPCPKTGDLLPQIPDLDYCGGCARHVSPAISRTARGICAGTMRAEEWIQRNMPRPTATPAQATSPVSASTRELIASGVIVVFERRLYSVTPEQDFNVGEGIRLLNRNGNEETVPPEIAAQMGLYPSYVLTSRGTIADAEQNADMCRNFLEHLSTAYMDAYVANGRATPPLPEGEAGEPAEAPVDTPLQFTEEYMRRYCFGQTPSGSVVRCHRPEGVAQHDVRELRILRIMSNVMSDRLRREGWVEFILSSPRRMVAQVRAVSTQPAYVTIRERAAQAAQTPSQPITGGESNEVAD